MRYLVGICAVLLLLARAGAGQSLNFVVIDLDDTRFDGTDLMPVLQMDLLGEGALFVESFAPSPLCSPSRASLLSGLYAARHGTEQIDDVIGGADTFRERGSDLETLAVWLDDAGYRTGLFGKYLNAYSAPTEGSRGPGGTFYRPPGWDRWWALHSPEHYGGIHGTSYEVIQEDGSRTRFADYTSDDQYLTDLSAELLRAFITDSVNASQPFLAVWTPYASHVEIPSYLPAPADRHLGAFSTLDPWRPPSWDEEDVSDKPRWVQAAGHDAASQVLTDDIRERVYETLLAVDEQIGALLAHLATLGVDQDTVVLLTSDNGVGWGEHRWFDQSKECPYEECLRVPMLVRYPAGIPSPPATVTAPVLNIDVAPTIAALANVSPPVAVDGESFDGWLLGSPPASWRTDFLIEHRRAARGDTVIYVGQVADGDQLRLFHGDPRAEPRGETLFEFDSGDGVSEGAVAVLIGADANASFSNLGDAVVANAPLTEKLHDATAGTLTIKDWSLNHNGVYWWEEVDQGAAFAPRYPVPDYFGVRDVENGYTWVEYETGERELYDLTLDPSQLENLADDPGYATIRQQLEARLDELLPPPLGPVCSDGLDNDRDGLTDFPADPGCPYAHFDLESPRCDNEDDDDGDGGIDWDGGSGGGTADSYCASVPWQDTEKKVVRRRCGLGAELILVPAVLFWHLRRRRREALRRRSF
jgi:arylsulfatase A-like enzyme